MEEFYLQIRTVHIWAVTASGLLFALRGGAFNLLGASWPKALPVRLLSWTVDAVLLSLPETPASSLKRARALASS